MDDELREAVEEGKGKAQPEWRARTRNARDPSEFAAERLRTHIPSRYHVLNRPSYYRSRAVYERWRELS